MCATRKCGLEINLQPCLASMAKLKAWRFRNPMSPFKFDLHMLFQLTQAILLSCYLCPHQNLLIIPSISSQSPLGSQKQLMV